MDSDPLTSPMGIKTTRKRSVSWSASVCMNVVVCGLCLISFLSSGYNSFREHELRSRVGSLEERVAFLEASATGSVDVLVDRLRRETVDNLRGRVVRDLASRRQNVERVSRDASECLCPAGMEVEKQGRNYDLYGGSEDEADRLNFCESVSGDDGGVGEVDGNVVWQQT
ncbi:hypothetical protein GWI33_007893 [Rhynchophorus ferrugineus]|uniref:Uncharacterized protein n=1 Tax=Rhynchophorus ferrugineus TaxID=354439 RepID=A0A834IH10_RHYFE|nr:hypothetical protein GWI33_007893 [Rhynchophorus ferrugineus]